MFLRGLHSPQSNAPFSPQDLHLSSARDAPGIFSQKLPAASALISICSDPRAGYAPRAPTTPTTRPFCSPYAADNRLAGLRAVRASARASMISAPASASRSRRSEPGLLGRMAEKRREHAGFSLLPSLGAAPGHRRERAGDCTTHGQTALV